MKVSYDREADAMIITLRNSPVDESDEVRPGVIADFGTDGGTVRIEILGVSHVVEDLRHVEFAVPVEDDDRLDSLMLYGHGQRLGWRP